MLLVTSVLPWQASERGAMAQTNSAAASSCKWGRAFEWEIRGVDVEEVWAVTGDFLGMQKWLPKLVQGCELEAGEPQKPGCVRKVVSESEGHIFYAIEELLSMDAGRFSYTYALRDCNGPGFSLIMDDYVGSITLCASSAEGEKATRFRWSYECRPVAALSQEEACNTIVFPLFQSAVDALKDIFFLPHHAVTLL